MKARYQPHLTLILILFVPFAAMAFAARPHTKEDTLLAYLSLLAVCWLLACKHKTELLRFRRSFAGTYFGLALVGWLISFYYDGAAKDVLEFIILMALGTSPFLVPGVLRLAAHFISRLFIPHGPGALEGISLMSSYVPFYAQAIRDATRYRLIERPWYLVILNTQLVLGLIVNIVDMMYTLSAAIMNRGFRIHAYVPHLILSPIEKIILLVVGGMLLWL